MASQIHTTVQLGELVVAAFDMAARHRADPMEVSRLATEVVAALLRRGARGIVRSDRPPAASIDLGCMA